MNVARTLDAERRSPRAVAAHLRLLQEAESARLADLYQTGTATDGQLAHLAQRVGLRGAKINTLEREIARDAA